MNICETCIHDGEQVYDLGTACTGCNKDNGFKYHESIYVTLGNDNGADSKQSGGNGGSSHKK